MRSFRLFVLLIVMAVFGIGISMAQKTATSTVQTFAVGSGFYSFDVYATRTNSAGGNILVGTSNLIVNTNRSGLSPIGMTITNVNPLYTGPPDHSTDYDPMRIDTITGAANAGKVAVTIVFTGNDVGAGTALALASPPGVRICTITMPIINPGLNAGLTWDQINSGLTDSRSQPIVNSFLGSDNGPLPIQLASFTARVNPTGGVRIDWMTASETNNYGFYVQRRVPGTVEWASVSPLIPGHGTTLQPQSYSFIDQTVVSGSYQYRLIQMDLDGTTHYIDPISINLGPTSVVEAAPREFALKQNYPNPFNPSTEIKFSVENTARTTLEVFNLLGQKVATPFDGIAEAGQYYKVRLNATSLTTGMYIYRLQSATRVEVKKMILLK